MRLRLDLLGGDKLRPSTGPGWERRRLARALLLATVLLLAAPAGADKPVPFLSGRVVDEADLLPPEAEARLDATLAELERTAGAQVAVLTVESLEGEVLEDYSLRVAETWKLGRRGKDDGVLVLVAEQDRKMRIEVGYGLEGVLTDLESRAIMDNVMRPAFRAGDFPGGIEKAVDSIGAAIRGEPLPEAPPGEEPGLEDAPWFMRAFFGFMFLVVVGTFSLAAVSAEGCHSWGLWLFLMPFFGGFPMVIFGTPWAGLVAVLAWAIGFPLVKRWHKTPGGKRFWEEQVTGSGGLGRWISVGGGGGGGGFRFGGGGGGFSGGGGGFGGGGSSGSW